MRVRFFGPILVRVNRDYNRNENHPNLNYQAKSVVLEVREPIRSFIGIRIYLIGGKMSGECDENFEGVTKFFLDEKIPRNFITRPKLLPDFFIPDRNFYAIFYTPTKTQIQIFYAFINRIMLYTSNYQIYFQASEGN